MRISTYVPMFERCYINEPVYESVAEITCKCVTETL